MKTALWLLLVLALMVAVLWWLGPIDFAAAGELEDVRSLKDIVTDSEGGKIPSLPEMIPPQSDPGTDDPVHSTPPRAPDAGGPGRVSTPATWGFVAWGPAGERMGGRLRDTRDECEHLRAQHRQQHPDWIFSPCVWVRAERGTL